MIYDDLNGEEDYSCFNPHKRLVVSSIVPVNDY